MEYLKVEWIHGWDDEPSVIYSEIDDCRRETRKIEVFRDGRIGYATSKIDYGGTLLSETPLPPLHSIASDRQFKPHKITQQSFEQVWKEKVKDNVTLASS
jgi:hypothetical protein